MVLAAVAQDGRALKHASVEMQAERDVVLAAVAQRAAGLVVSQRSRMIKRLVLSLVVTRWYQSQLGCYYLLALSLLAQELGAKLYGRTQVRRFARVRVCRAARGQGGGSGGDRKE